MSTRSRIGILQEDGSVKSIYCHYDGYPEHTGKTLVENYTSPVEVNNLIERGDLRFLNDNPKDNEHYKETRGEEDAIAILSGTPSIYRKDCADSWGEFAYLYKDGEWEYCQTRGGGTNFLPVQSVLKNLS
jgi:hypothetical protein